MRFLTGYMGSRLGVFLSALAASFFIMFLHRSDHQTKVRNPAPGPGTRGNAAPTEQSAVRVCREAGWPKTDLAVPSRTPRLPSLLPGAFPPLGSGLPAEGRGLVSLKKELESPGLPRVRRADLTLRLARGYAIRALYFRGRLVGPSLQKPTPRLGRSGNQKTGHGVMGPRKTGTMGRRGDTGGKDGLGHGRGRRRSRYRRRSAAGPFARPMTRQELLRRYRAAIRGSDFYYRDLMGRKYRKGMVPLDRVLYEHASLLLMAGRMDDAVAALENLVTSVPESRFSRYARAALVVSSARRGDCSRAIRLGAKLDLDALQFLGSLAGYAVGRCLLSAKDPARAAGWLDRVVRRLAKEATQSRGEHDGRKSSVLLLGACRSLAKALSQSAQADGAVRQAMALPKPASVLVLSELRRIYRKEHMYRQQMDVCRAAGALMARESGPVSRLIKNWLDRFGTSPKLDPVDLRRGRLRPRRLHRTARGGSGTVGRAFDGRRRRRVRRRSRVGRGPSMRSGRAAGAR